MLEFVMFSTFSESQNATQKEIANNIIQGGLVSAVVLSLIKPLMDVMVVDQDFGKTTVKSKYVFINILALKAKGRWLNILYIKYCNTLMKPLLILSMLNK